MLWVLWGIAALFVVEAVRQAAGGRTPDYRQIERERQALQRWLRRG